MARKVNEAALKIIRDSEGLALKAYVCPAGKLTIGYGHTGGDVRAGMAISKDQAEALLEKDVSAAAGMVERLTANVCVNDNEFGAMVSLCFNIGVSNFAGSTLLKHVCASRYSQAANEFPRWVYGGGKRLPGLVARRERERQLFIS